MHPQPISSLALAWEHWPDPPRFRVRSKHLTRAAVGDDYRVGVVIEELDPGCRSAPAHFHVFEEEHVLILEGSVTLRLGDETHRMTAGDYVCFPAGQQAGHCLVNDGEATCRYLVFGERNPNDVIVYTDTNKVLVRALGRRNIFDMGARRSYWEGEDTGLPAGVPPPADAVDVPPLRPPPRPPIATEDVAWEETSEGTRFGGQAKHLTYAAVGEGYHVGMLIEAPAPGRRLAPMHYHMLEEEHALIVEGEVALFWGDERLDLEAGDYVCFPAGLKVAHSFMNAGSGPCRYLMIGERNRDEVCVYPDSNKMAVVALRTAQDVFDMSGVRGYWDGELD